jgi:sulfate adenylyltransferase subunit 2
MLLAVLEWLAPRDGKRVVTETVRYRTVGDMTETGAVRSTARDVASIIE